MKRYGHGLVIGTFCPPHAGHHHLVRTAEDRCSALTVLVCAAAGERAARTGAPVLFCAGAPAGGDRHLRLLTGPSALGGGASGKTVVLRGSGPAGLLAAALDAVDTFLGESWGLDGGALAGWGPAGRGTIDPGGLRAPVSTRGRR